LLLHVGNDKKGSVLGWRLIVVFQTAPFPSA
jgi:hypothetical protein